MWLPEIFLTSPALSGWVAVLSWLDREPRMEDRENIFCLLTCFNHATLIIGLLLFTVLYFHGSPSTTPASHPPHPDGWPHNRAPEIKRGVVSLLWLLLSYSSKRVEWMGTDAVFKGVWFPEVLTISGNEITFVTIFKHECFRIYVDHNHIIIIR